MGGPARADSAGIPSLNSRDAETGGAASESGCSISTLLLYQGESQNLVHTHHVVQHSGEAVSVMRIACTFVMVIL